jgi:two-component system cell cycle sensor histidine kinase/response regulator CckA
VQIEVFLGDLIGLLQAAAGDQVDVQIQVAPDLPPLWIDQQAMSQVLMDLLINAYEAMPDGGEIRVRADGTALPEHLMSPPSSAPPGKTYVRIRITDTGVGMDEDLVATVFEPFVSTKHTVGVGMGLSSAYGLVRSEGGYMDVESVLGEGTTFYVYLPVVERGIDGA